MPVAGLGAVMALSFSFLSQLERPMADQLAEHFGGHGALAFLNSAVDLQSSSSASDSAREWLARGGVDVACSETSTLLIGEGGRNHPTAYREFDPSCDAGAFGYALIEGTWPRESGEVVATEGAGYRVGDSVSGLAPASFSVVGLVTWEHDARAAQVLAAAGTWASMGWPGAAERYPQSSATMTVYVADRETAALESVLGAAALDDPDAGSAQVVTAHDYARDQPATARDRFPWVYDSAAPIAGAAAGAVTVGLRRKWITGRLRQFAALGARRRVAGAALVLAVAALSLIASVAGVLVGWAASLALPPIAEWVVGGSVSGAPAPWDPLMRYAVPAAAVAIAGAGVAVLAGSSDRPVALATPSLGAKKPRAAWQALAVLGVLVSAGGIAVIRDPSAVFVLVVAVCGAVAVWAQPLAAVGLRFLPARGPASRMASRRMLWRPAAAGGQLIVGALSLAPVIAMLLIVGASIDRDNAIERLPPDQGQALVAASLSDATNGEVTAVMREVTGADYSEIRLVSSIGDDREWVTAHANSIGAVAAVADIAALETVTGVPADEEVRRAFDSGGVVWLGDGGEAHLWVNRADGTSVAVQVPAVATIDASERWANAYDALVSVDAISSHGWSPGETQILVVGISDQEAERVATLLVDAGLAADIVRLYQGEAPFGVTPFVAGLVGAMAAASGAAALATGRASYASLVAQTAAMFALGAPRSWLGRVLALESAATYGFGAVLGVVIGAGASALGLSAMGFPIAVPWLAVTCVLVAASVLYGGALVFALRGLEARVHDAPSSP